MLNRKLSDYLFYGALALILLGVFVIRTISLGNINGRIDEIELSNISLNAQINALEKVVEENKDLQSDHLYELYNRVPSYYTTHELEYSLRSYLQQIGITDTSDTEPDVTVSEPLLLGDDPRFLELNNTYTTVQVEVTFNTYDLNLVEDLLVRLLESDQVFLINAITFNTPDGENPVGVEIQLYTFYNITEEATQ